MPDAYLTPAAPVTAELEVKRSIFRCDLTPVADETEARAAVETARKTFWDARHHCSAFVLGPTSQLRRSNDDGEPSGTAGMPMLDVLLGAHVTDVVAVVTRWFGGTLLGTGGLVKAYGDAVREALNAASLERYEFRELLRAAVPVASIGKIEHGLRAAGYVIVEVNYPTGTGVDALLEVAVTPEEADRANSTLAEFTAGQSVFTREREIWVKV